MKKTLWGLLIIGLLFPNLGLSKNRHVLKSPRDPFIPLYKKRLTKAYIRLVQKDFPDEFYYQHYDIPRGYRPKLILFNDFEDDKFFKMDEEARKLFVAGWEEYKADNLPAALAKFDQIIEEYNESLWLDTAMYWSAKIYRSQGDMHETKLRLDFLSKKFPMTFYGMMVRGRLGLDFTLSMPPAPEYQSDPILDPINGLIDKGKKEMAIDLLDQLIKEDQEGEVNLTRLQHLQITLLYQKANAYLSSIRRLNKLNRETPFEQQEMEWYWSLFPNPDEFWWIVEAYAKLRNLNPAMVLGLIRQESAFEKVIVSHAGARGLMQLMPATAQDIADELEIIGYHPDRLFEPGLNINFGTYYLDQQMLTFDNIFYYVFAAYNAGPKNAQRWRNEIGHLEVDELIQSIDFRETRGYVKSVLRNFANYLRTYGRQDQVPFFSDLKPWFSSDDPE